MTVTADHRSIELPGGLVGLRYGHADPVPTELADDRFLTAIATMNTRDVKLVRKIFSE
jgi:hypothetical protein